MGRREGGRNDGGTETKWGEMLLCHVMMEWVRQVGDLVKGVLGIKKGIKKNHNDNKQKKAGQNAAPQPVCQPEEEKEEIKAQGTKGNFQQKSCTKHQEGRKIYICKIYIKRRVYGYILKGVIYLTLGVLPTFWETWTRDFYKKQEG